jgi:N-acetylmuramic acid 6-phosphate etherase
MNRITESSSLYDDLEKMSTLELLKNINREDQKVALAVQNAIPMIERLVDGVFKTMEKGGRLFYIGAGTSGRLGIVDASECPPTFGVPDEWVIGIIAGGDPAIRKAKEFAEDDPNLAWQDLKSYGIDRDDIVVGIAASGTTPYVVHGLRQCQEAGILTGCITNNKDTPLVQYAHFPVEVIVGPEFVTGSTRMKAGTSQKLVLNMVSTSVMIKLGRVVGNTMVDMQLTNNKLVDRGTKILMRELGLEYDRAKDLLLSNGSVRRSMASFYEKKDS